MADLVHYVKSYSTQVNTTSTSAVEETNYTVSWANLTGAGFANGDNIAIVVLVGFGVNSGSAYGRCSVRVGSTFAGASELPGALSDRESGSSSYNQQYTFIDEYTLATNDNIYFAKWVNGNTGRWQDFAIMIFNRDDLTSSNYQYAETTPSGNASTSPTDGASVTLSAGNWLLFGMTQWLDDDINANALMRFNVGGSDYAQVDLEGEDTANTINIGSMFYAGSISDSTTAKITYNVNTGTTHDCIKTKIVAIKLSAFTSGWGAYSGTPVTPSVLGTYYEIGANNSYSKTNTGALIALGMGAVVASSSNFGVNTRVQEAEANWPASSTWGSAYSSDNTNCVVPRFAFGYSSSLTSGTYNFDFDFSENITIAGQSFDELSVVLFSLDFGSSGVTVNLDGAAATGAAGTFGVTTGSIVSIIGTSAEGQVGSFSIQAGAIVSLSGIVATALAGDFVATGGALVNLTGVEAIGQVGDFAITLGGGVTVNLDGVSVTGYAGDFSVTGGANIFLDGVSLTGSAGDFGVTGCAIITINGVSATATAADITAIGGAIASLTGVSVTGSVGDIATSTGATVTISGVSATAQAAVFTIAAGATVSIIGVGATGQAGTITVSLESGIDIVIPGYRIYTIEQADRKYLVLQQDRTYAIERNNKYPIH